MKNFIKSIFLLLFLSSFLVIVSCSKDDSSSSSGGIFSFFKSKSSSDDSLLENNIFAKKISVDSPLFILWDTTNKGYQNLVKKYPQAVASNTLESLAKNDVTIKNYFEILKRIFNTDKIDAASFASKGAFFFEELRDGSFPVAMYTKLENKINGEEIYNAIKEFAKENKFTYKDIDIAGNNAVSVNFINKGLIEFTLNFLVKDNGVAISNRVNLVERYLDNDFDSGYFNKLIKENENFEKSYKKSLKDGTTSFGLATLILNSKFLPDQKVQEELSKLPVKNLVLNQAFNNNDMLVTRIASYYTPQTDEQKKIANVLNSSNSVNAPTSIPQNTMASITVSMKLIKSLIEEFNLEKEVAPYAHLLDMENINLTIQGPSGSMFPSIALVAQKANNPNMIIKDVKDTISSAKGAFPIPLNAWQKKQINNMDVEYLITPFGVGIFMAQNGDSLILASSEAFIADITSKDAIKTADAIRAKYDTRKNSIFNMYGSSKAFARALRTLNTTLSTFAKKDIPNLDETIALLEQSPNTIIDIFSEDNTIIGETKVVLE